MFFGYRNRYAVQTRDLKQPLVTVRRTERWLRNLHGEQSVIKLVPEHCVVTGITDEMRANYKLMSVS